MDGYFNNISIKSGTTEFTPIGEGYKRDGRVLYYDKYQKDNWIILYDEGGYSDSISN